MNTIDSLFFHCFTHVAHNWPQLIDVGVNSKCPKPLEDNLNFTESYIMPFIKWLHAVSYFWSICYLLGLLVERLNVGRFLNYCTTLRKYHARYELCGKTPRVNFQLIHQFAFIFLIINWSNLIVEDIFKGILQSERFTLVTYVCITYWLCIVIVHKDR